MRLRVVFAALALAALVLVGCSKEDPRKDTTYTLSVTGMTVPDASKGQTWEYIIFEYSEQGEKVGQNSAFYTADPLIQKFTVKSEHAVKVKVYIDARANGKRVLSNWVQQVYYLKDGENTDINLDGSTIIGTKEP